MKISGKPTTLAPLLAASCISRVVLATLPFKSFQHGSAWIAATLIGDDIVEMFLNN
jgi:hypothetical protein